MILTVTPNPALDATYGVAALAPGETHRVQPAVVRAGGKGVNVARILQNQGLLSMVVAPVGGSTGTEFETDLRLSHLPHRLVPVTAPTRRSTAIVDASTGLTTLLNETGTALSTSEWSRLDSLVRHQVIEASVVVVSGSLPPEAPPQFCAAIVGMAQAGSIPCIVDATGAALYAAAVAGADLLKPNRLELEEVSGQKDPILGARMLLDLGARSVLVSLGTEGMLLLRASAPGEVLRAKLIAPLAGNATGAGDAAVAAAASLLAGRSGLLTDADSAGACALLRRATAWSAAAVLTPQAGDIHDSWPQLEDAIVVTTV